MATRPKFAKMANYLCECVEASHIFLKKPFGECERMYRVRAKQGGKFGEFSQFLSQVILYTKKDIFMYKTIQSTLAKFAKFAKFAKLAKFAQYSPNLLNTRQIRRSESQKFAQYLPNLPERDTKIWQIFGEYSHSPNSLASCHCLKTSQAQSVGTLECLTILILNKMGRFSYGQTPL